MTPKRKYYLSWCDPQTAPDVLGTETGEKVEGSHSLAEAERLARLVRSFYAAGWPTLFPTPNDVPIAIRSVETDAIVSRAEL